MTNDEKLNILERNAKSPLPGQEQEAETLLWLIALARIGAAVQSLRTSAIYYEGALGVKLVPSESGEPLLHMIADSLSALPQVKP